MVTYYCGLLGFNLSKLVDYQHYSEPITRLDFDAQLVHPTYQ